MKAPAAPHPLPARSNDERDAFAQAGVLVVRRGPGANCSSIGSAVEMLFLSTAVGATVLATVTAMLSPASADRGAESAGGSGTPRAGAPPDPPSARAPTEEAG